MAKQTKKATYQQDGRVVPGELAIALSSGRKEFLTVLRRKVEDGEDVIWNNVADPVQTSLSK